MRYLTADEAKHTFVRLHALEGGYSRVVETGINQEGSGMRRCRCMHPWSSHGPAGCNAIGYQSRRGGVTITCSCPEKPPTEAPKAKGAK